MKRDIYDIIADIVSACQDYCDKEGLSVDVAHGREFAWFEGTSLVTINLLQDFQDELFMKNILKNGLSYDCGSFLASFFHEIGHYYTNNWLTKKELKYCDKAKENLNGMKEEDNLLYFSLLDETLATDWAIDYINENKSKLNILADQLTPLFDIMELDDLKNVYEEIDQDEIVDEYFDVLAEILNAD